MKKVLGVLSLAAGLARADAGTAYARVAVPHRLFRRADRCNALRRCLRRVHERESPSISDNFHYLVRASDERSCQPANLNHASNQRLICPETVGDRQMEMLLGTLHNGGGALPHAHPGIGYLYLLYGSAHVELAGLSFDMVPGDAYVFPADQLRVFAVTSDVPAKLLDFCSPPYGDHPDRVVRAV